MVLRDAAEASELERAHIKRLRGIVDGFMIAARWLSDAELHRQRPVVLFNREVEGLSSVVTDSADGSGQIVEHLASLGPESILYLSGPRASWSDAKRWQALSAASKAAGITLAKAGPFLATVAQGAATAVVAFNDQLVIGVLRRFLNRGVRVPAEVSVVAMTTPLARTSASRR